MSQEAETEWLKASQVLKLLTADGRSPAEVEAMIAAYLRNGQLRAQAEKIWESEERFTTQAWKSCPPDAEGGPIRTLDWRREKNILEDRAQWRFVANRFLVTKTLKPRCRIMMKGVSFNLYDLKKLQPKIFGTPGPKTRRGRPPEIEKRDAAWEEALEVILEKIEALPIIRSQAELGDDIKKGAVTPNGDSVGEKQADEVAKLAINVLKRVEKSRNSVSRTN